MPTSVNIKQFPESQEFLKEPPTRHSSVWGKITYEASLEVNSYTYLDEIKCTTKIWKPCAIKPNAIGAKVDPQG